MKQYRRISACILAVLLLVSAFAVGAFAANPAVKIVSPSTLPEVGKTFTVSVEISGNPGLCAVQYTLAFDDSVVDCQSIQLGSILDDMLSATNAVGDSGAIIACASAESVNENGTLAEYTFEVLKAGEPKFALQDCVFCGTDGKTVSVQDEQTGQTVAEQQKTSAPQTATVAEQKQPAVDSDTVVELDAEEVTASSTQTFTDVPATYWGYSYIEKAAEAKLVSGNPDGSFAPEKEMTRAEFVTMLFRLSGDAAVATDAGFIDVAADDWYRDAVNWAAAKGYVKGSNGKFLPNGKITRQEVVTILYRYAGGMSGTESLLSDYGLDNLASFKDAGQISAWATDAMRWAVYNSIVSGTTADTVSPNGTAKRAQVAAIFVRYAEKQAS